MKCIYCNGDINKDDNFCPSCGHWTVKGYSLLKKGEIKKKIGIKKNNHLLLFGYLFVLLLIIFVVTVSIRGDNLFKPFAYLKKQVLSNQYGYERTLMKTENKYQNEIVNDYDDAIKYIKKDFNSQKYLCLSSDEVDKIEYDLENKYNVPSISFCDMDIVSAKEMKKVIEKMYSLFPNTLNALTNITISNTNNDNDYIAYFQPMYQFINVNEDINEYNKVNKTQILINSYYFLNKDAKIRENWYVKDATKESTFAHEFGHYLSFITLLKDYQLDNIILETKDNSAIIKNVLEEYKNGNHSRLIIEKALDEYNESLNMSLDIKAFASEISMYAVMEDSYGNIIYDEVIAEAVHDYYLHDSNMKKASYEIIKILKEKLR